MAVELEKLYVQLIPEYNIRLCTQSCFEKRISWIHMVEDIEFTQFLHGNELLFNSGLNYESNEWLKKFIDCLCEKNAGGLIVGMHDGMGFPQEIVDYCNEKKLPLFSASWDTPYIDIMRLFSEILLKNEQIEANLVNALKNAIYYPDSQDMYQNHLERNGFFEDYSYNVIRISCHTYDTDKGNSILEDLERDIRYSMKKSIIYKEQGILTVLVAGHFEAWVKECVRDMCENDENIYAGIGITVNKLNEIHRSFESAQIAYQLTKTAIPKNYLVYNELGIYKILTDFKEPTLYTKFVDETLGSLLQYDREHQTDYVAILQAYFENECSTVCTAQALYCHKNTLTYKLNAIKEILGYDILNNENRTKIMLSFYILRIGEMWYNNRKA